MRSTSLFVWTIVVCLIGAGLAGAQDIARPTMTRTSVLQSADASAGQPQLATPAQTGSNAPASVPRLIRFSGILQNLAGRAISGPVDVTFSLYAEQAGGSALWFETQTVQADSLGRYSALLGAMSPAGVPIELFTDSQARWLGVMIQGLPEQSRVLLVSVPYALKAGDAETLGGRPAADYQLTPDSTASTDSVAKQGTTTTRGGTKKATGKTGSPTPQTLTATQNYIPVMTANDGSLGNSVMYQSGGFIGVGTTAPAFPFDLNSNVFAIGPKASLPGAGGTMRFRDDTGTVRWLFGIPGSAGSQDFFMYNNVNGHAPIYIQNGAASYSLYMASTGSVGLLTTAPAFPLDVNGNVLAVGTKAAKAGNGGELRLRDDTGTVRWALGLPTASGATDFFVSNVVNSHVPLYIQAGAPTNALYVNSTGKVGIGNAAPAHSLDVAGDINASGNIIAAGTISAANLTFTNTATPDTFVGFQAGSVSDTGGFNTAFGRMAYGAGTTGTANTAVGDQALNLNSTGSNNTAVGSASLELNTGGNYDTAVGGAALLANSTGSYNSALGYQALYGNTTGYNNTASGYQALYKNTTGHENTAAGYQALNNNTSGNGNTAIGDLSLEFNSTGNENAALGRDSLIDNTTGALNTAVGDNALFENTSASYNTAVGEEALFYNCYGVSDPCGAIGNTGVGYQVGITTNSANENRSGAHNTFIGFETGPSTSTQLSNASAIGANAVVGESNALVLGSINGVNGATSSVNVGIGTATPATTLQVVGDLRVGTSSTNGCVQNFAGTALTGTCSSDQRLKKNIRPFEPLIEKLTLLQPVHFNWRADEFPEYHFGPATNSGLIAQQVEKVFPEMVTTDQRGYKTVNYGELPYLLLEGVRELKTRNDSLRGLVTRQNAQIAGLRQANAAKDARLDALESQNRELVRDVAQMRQAQSQMAALEARLARLESAGSRRDVKKIKHGSKPPKPAHVELAGLGY